MDYEAREDDFREWYVVPKYSEGPPHLNYIATVFYRDGMWQSVMKDINGVPTGNNPAMLRAVADKLEELQNSHLRPSDD
jgi:hypothetical protein